MLTWLNVVRFLCVGFLLTACVGIAAWVMAKEFRDMVRRVEAIGAFANLRRWADKNRYTILFREQVWDSPFLKIRSAQVVFRMVVQDQRGERKWAWVLSCSPFEVRWTKPESWFASSSVARSSSKDEHLDGTQVTDAVLAHLKGLTKLSELWLDGTQVTDAGVRELQQALRGWKMLR